MKIRLGCKAEIDQDLSRFVAATAFDMHRKPKLADKRSAGRMIRADAPAKVLDHKAVFLAAGGDRELIVLRDDADGDTVQGRDGSRESVCFNGRCCSEKICEQEAERSQCSSAGHIAPRRFNASKAAGTDKFLPLDSSDALSRIEASSQYYARIMLQIHATKKVL